MEPEAPEGEGAQRLPLSAAFVFWRTCFLPFWLWVCFWGSRGQSPPWFRRVFLRRVLRSRRADRADAAGLGFAFSPAGRDYFA